MIFPHLQTTSVTSSQPVRLEMYSVPVLPQEYFYWLRHSESYVRMGVLSWYSCQVGTDQVSWVTQLHKGEEGPPGILILWRSCIHDVPPIRSQMKHSPSLYVALHLSSFFRSLLWCWISPLWWLLLGFWVISVNPMTYDQWPSVLKFESQFATFSMSC